jgi:pimeloyl-ACP methyl ester carboxylesterase
VDEIEIGRFHAQLERPEPIKFAWPIVLLPELFTTARHLAIVFGYLTTMGWEVYLPDLRAGYGRDSTPALGELRFKDLAALATELIDAIGREVVVVGHGVGGLVALALGAHRAVKASVAYAPLVPGFRTALGGGAGNSIATMMGRPIKPPAGRTLFELLADVEPFMRESLIKTLVPDSGALLADVIRGGEQFEAGDKTRPRLIVAGESDLFAPLNATTKFGESIGAKVAIIGGRGHWLIGGRALERAIHETQRFLVRALGQDLLLLYPEEWKTENGEKSGR